MEDTWHRTVDTPYGEMVIFWRGEKDDPKIERISLTGKQDPGKEIPSLRGEQGCPAIDAIARDLQSYFAGQPVRFTLDVLDLDACSDFQREVLVAEFHIPRGYVSTYQRIARHLGRSKGSRAVGNALAGNPFPIIIPCHRAVRTDGSLGGYQGGVHLKRRLLEMEGVRFTENDRVLFERVYY